MNKRAVVRAVALAAAVALAGIAASPVFAAEKKSGGAGTARHEEKIANIRKLVHIMSGKQMKDMMDKMLQSTLQAIESQMPREAQADPEMRQVLDEYLKSLALGEKDLEEMLDLMIPYYDKYLDDADIAEMVSFYESPAGKKLIGVMPEMMAEMMPRIMGWQMEKLKGATERLQERIEAIQRERSKETQQAGPRG